MDGNLIIGFIVGCLWTRLYYALWGLENGDWMKSWLWFDNKYWTAIHKVFCWSCPKKHTCIRKS